MSVVILGFKIIILNGGQLGNLNIIMIIDHAHHHEAFVVGRHSFMFLACLNQKYSERK